MKAVVVFKDGISRRQKTIEVDKNEPNYIIRKLAEVDGRVHPYTYVLTVKCGIRKYQWFGNASEAGVC